MKLALAGVFGTRVKVYNGKGSGGSIEIEFFGKDDLKKLAQQLKHLNNLNFNFSEEEKCLILSL